VFLVINTVDLPGVMGCQLEIPVPSMGWT